MKTDLLTAKKNHIFTVVLLIVMAVQVSMIWFWTMRKTNLFADELLSFGYAPRTAPRFLSVEHDDIEAGRI